MFKKDSKSKSDAQALPTSFSQQVVPSMPGKSSQSKSSGHTTLIAQDTTIKGDIVFSGLLEIEGVVKGNISAGENTDAHVRLQALGKIEGDVRVPRVVINGEVKGTVLSSTLELASKAMVEGNVHYSTIEMMKGAQVNGSLVHEANALSASNGKLAKAAQPAAAPKAQKEPEPAL